MNNIKKIAITQPIRINRKCVPSTTSSRKSCPSAFKAVGNRKVNMNISLTICILFLMLAADLYFLRSKSFNFVLFRSEEQLLHKKMFSFLQVSV